MTRETWRDRLRTFIAYVIAWSLLIGAVGLIYVAIIWALSHAPVPSAPQPPAMTAPLMDITRWCLSQGIEAYTETERYSTYDAIKKETGWNNRTVTKYRDSEPKFLACMTSYEYTVKR